MAHAADDSPGSGVLRQIGSVNANLPWDNLRKELSAAASLVQATSNQDYVDQCYPEFRDNAALERSNENLSSQPSGLCLTWLSCAFENCMPFDLPDVAQLLKDPTNVNNLAQWTDALSDTLMQDAFDAKK